MSKKDTRNEICIYAYKIMVYSVNYIVFAIIFSLVNKELLRMGRVSTLTVFVYILNLVLILPIFRSFDIGRRKSKPVIFSTAVVYLLSLISIYLVQLIMTVRLDIFNNILTTGLVLFIPIYLVQITALVIFGYLGNFLYFKLFDAARTLIIYEDKTNLDKIEAYVISHDKQYRLLKTQKNNIDYEIDYGEYDLIFCVGIKSTSRYKIQEKCFINSIDLFYTSSVGDVLSGKTRTTVIDDVLMIESPAVNFTIIQRFMKRFIDIVFAIILLILTSPVFLIVGIAIKLDDGGNILYRQERVTKDRKTFNIIKFRSMKNNSGDQPVSVGDSRITKIGHIIRKLRIDELPQLINILKGEMSVVGPRPESKTLLEEIEKETPEFAYRLKVKAGLTGYAQIFGKYNTTAEQKLILDLKYIVNYTVANDIKLILQTVNVFFNPGDSTAGHE